MKYRIKEKVLSLHGAYRVFDEEENVCYHVKQNAVSITNKTHLYNAGDEEIALIHRKVLSMHSVHYVEMANGESAQISEAKLFQLHDNFEIGGFGWQVKGDITGHNFEILDGAGRTIAEASEKWISIGDSLGVDIPDAANTEKVIAVLITILLIQRDRTSAMANASGSTSGSAQ